MRRRTLLSLAGLAAAAAVLTLGWILLAPQGIGGGTAYAVVEGSSMQPLLGGGDLAVIRREDAYTVGEVVAYRSDRLGQIVLHRIVATRSRGSRGDTDG